MAKAPKEGGRGHVVRLALPHERVVLEQVLLLRIVDLLALLR
jgi:hypothetical protein